LLIRLVIQMPPASSNANPSGNQPCPNVTTISRGPRPPRPSTGKREASAERLHDGSQRPEGSGRISFV
jgi:hypothetical protein